MNIKPEALFKKFLERMQHTYSIQKKKPTSKPNIHFDDAELRFEEIVRARCHTCLREYRLLLTKETNYTKVGKVGHTYEIRVNGNKQDNVSYNRLLFGFEGEFVDNEIIIPEDWFTSAYKIAMEKKLSTCTKFDVMK
jgi:hypothetical protein